MKAVLWLDACILSAIERTSHWIQIQTGWDCFQQRNAIRAVAAVPMLAQIRISWDTFSDVIPGRVLCCLTFAFLAAH